MSLLVPDTGLLFWMTLSFGIVLLILVRYVFPQIIKGIDARNDRINHSLEEARKAEEALTGVKKEAARIHEEASRQYASMIAEAGELKKKILAEAREEAIKEVAAIREKAVREINDYRRQAIKQAGDEIIELSARIAEKALGQTLDTPAKQKDLITQLLEEELPVKKN